MAIIISSDIKVEPTLNPIDLDYNVDIDLNKKLLNKMDNFPGVIAGDNNSISLVFKAPFEYQGVDLYGTNCFVSYDTTWTDENGIPSSGQVDLTNTCIEKEDGLYYTWVLDIKQTGNPGMCNFNIHFIMNLEEDPYINNTNIFIQENEDSSINFGSLSVIEANLKYWSVSTIGSAFEILNSGLPLDSDYNLVIPDNLGQQLEEANQILEECQELLEEINNNPGGGGNIDLTDYVKNTDYATSNKGGVVKSNSGGGVIVDEGGLLYIYPSSKDEIKTRVQRFKPIVPDTLNYAVKEGITNNTEILTDAEKAAAQAWLGISDLVGDIETLLGGI